MTGTGQMPGSGMAEPDGRLLTLEGDPEPVEWVNPDSECPVLLVCEHAGQAIPSQLEGLGLPEGAVDLHIGWDIGAEQLARAIALDLDAPLILQRYSRLVIDCNRPPGADSSIPEISDHVPVPGNRRLDPAEREQRRRLIFDPLDAAFAEGFARFPRRAAFSIHTYTRRMSGEKNRPWDAGFLCRRDMGTAQALLDHVAGAASEVQLAINEPYRIEEEGDWFIPRHAEPRGMRHSLIEVCNDQVRTEAQSARWARLLSGAIRAVLEG